MEGQPTKHRGRVILHAILVVVCLVGLPSVSFARTIDPDFPDVIACTRDQGNSYEGLTYMYVSWKDVSSNFWPSAMNSVGYYAPGFGQTVYFNPDGTFEGADSPYTGGDCDGFSISDLTTNGQTFNFGGGSGTTTQNINYSTSTDVFIGNSTSTDTQIFLTLTFQALLFFISGLVITVWIFLLLM